MSKDPNRFDTRVYVTPTCLRSNSHDSTIDAERFSTDSVDLMDAPALPVPTRQRDISSISVQLRNVRLEVVRNLYRR
jgi:hypothetical protein